MKIALCGKMRGGKDTIAEYAFLKYGFSRFAFGDGIREVCRLLFPEQMKNGNKPRSLLQGVGQMMRQVDGDVWVNKCFREIERREEVRKEHSDLFNVVFQPVITDLRQPNEFLRCKKEGFTIIKVYCDEEIRLQRILAQNDKFDPKDLQHETELHIDTFECDYVINNNGSLEDLYKQFDEIMAKLNG